MCTLAKKTAGVVLSSIYLNAYTRPYAPFVLKSIDPPIADPCTADKISHRTVLLCSFHWFVPSSG